MRMDLLRRSVEDVVSEDPRCFEFRPAPDTGWILMNAFKIIMMQAGFALMESSYVRTKNSANIVMKNVADLGLGAVAYWVSGWSLAFGVDEAREPGNSFCGNGEFFLQGTADYAAFVFQLAFAATAATIDSGAVAERMNFKPYLMYTTILTGIVQPIAVHWVWDERGWLFKRGYHDFAGSGPVHIIGGVSALVAAAFIGPRIGRFRKKGVIGKLHVQVIQGENVPTRTEHDPHPYVVLKQLNHGSKECRSNVAMNGRFPRWGSQMTFDVHHDSSTTEEKALMADKYFEGEISLRIIELSHVPDHWGLWPRHVLDDEDFDDAGKPIFSRRWLRIKTDVLELCELNNAVASISPDSIAANSDESLENGNFAGSLLISVNTKSFESVLPWQREHVGFTITLKDKRSIEFSTQNIRARNTWLSRIYKAWRPRISPMLLELRVKDDKSGKDLDVTQFEISATDKADPGKFACKVFAGLSQGGRVEMLVTFTDWKRMKREKFQGCDPVKLLFGLFVLWINWFSFNVDSTQGISDNNAELASRVAVNTLMASAAGAVFGMVASDVCNGYIEPEKVANGILAALVSITACCSCVSVNESMLIGLIGAIFEMVAEEGEKRLRIDDPCAAFPIHAVAGAWGVIAVGFFGEIQTCTGILDRNGLFRGGGWGLLGTQCLAVIAMCVWTAVTCLFVLWVMYVLSRHFRVFHFLVLRPSRQIEEMGFDETVHNIRRHDSINPPHEDTHTHAHTGCAREVGQLAERKGGKDSSIFQRVVQCVVQCMLQHVM